MHVVNHPTNGQGETHGRYWKLSPLSYIFHLSDKIAGLSVSICSRAAIYTKYVEKRTWPVTGGPLKDLNDFKLSLNEYLSDSPDHLGSICTIQNLQRSPIPQTTFFEIRYNEPANAVQFQVNLSKKNLRQIGLLRNGDRTGGGGCYKKKCGGASSNRSLFEG